MPAGDPALLQLRASDGELLEVRAAAHPRSRRLRLSVGASGARVSYPVGTRAAQILAFAQDHADWLQLKLRELALPGPCLPPLQFAVAAQIPLRGQQWPLHWEAASFPRIQWREGELWLGLPPGHARPLRLAQSLLAGFFEDQLRHDVARDLGLYTARLGRAPTGLQVRRLKSLWGSLDTRDRVNLDLSLIMAPPEALRYVLVHELCHLRVRNHSPRFWAEVEQLMPHWREQRRWLRRHGTRLKAEMERLLAAEPV